MQQNIYFLIFCNFVIVTYMNNINLMKNYDFTLDSNYSAKLSNGGCQQNIINGISSSW